MHRLNALVMIAVSAVILILSIRGHRGNPTASDLLMAHWREDGPFELSPERGRYALTYSLLEDHSYSFGPHLAAFVAPDVAYTQQSFVSLFPPGLSYVVMPGYAAGRAAGLAQVGTFATVAVFALLNVILVYMIAIRLGASRPAAVVSALVFLFATPAYTYAVSLYQHHPTTFLLLVMIYLVSGRPSPLRYAGSFFVYAAAFLLDTPNIILFAPVFLISMYRLYTALRESSQEYGRVRVVRGWRYTYLLAPLAALIPLAVLIHFNYKSYGDPFQLGGMVRRATSVEFVTDTTGSITAEVKEFEQSSGRGKTPTAFFKTRNIPNGLFTHFFAHERGIIFFTPVILFSILGLYTLRKSEHPLIPLLLSTAAAVVTLYSLWGDPYGGWAFGSRYLIPFYAVMSPFIAAALTHYRRDTVLLLLFSVFAVYSLSVNTVGALTTSTDPPGPELESLERTSGIPQPGGYLPNYLYLTSGKTKSFIYNDILRPYITPHSYAIVLIGALTAFIGIQLITLKFDPKDDV